MGLPTLFSWIECDSEAETETETETEVAVVQQPTMSARVTMSTMAAVTAMNVAETMEATTMETTMESMEETMVVAHMDDRATPAQNRARAAELTTEGNRLSLQGRLPDAIARFREATLMAPGYAPAWRGLGIANERMSRNADALRAFRRYIQLAPTAPDAPRIQARIEALE